MRHPIPFRLFDLVLLIGLELVGAVACDPAGVSPPPSGAGGTGSSSGAAGDSSLTATGGAVAGAGGGIVTVGSGASGGGSGGSSGGTDGGQFVLAWQDDFDALDSSRWQAQDFTFDGNQATFTPANVNVKEGTLELSLTRAAEGSAKPYLGVELRSAETLTYGKVSTRMRFAQGSGVVSSVVLFYTPWPNCDWNEIDIEHLGKTPNGVQVNAMVFPGVQDPNCTQSVTPVQDPLLAALPFDAEADFHVYDIEWTPAGVDYYADGQLLRTWTKNIALLQRPLTVLLTVWASSAASWAGPLNDTSVPSRASVDWIKVYAWKG